MSNLQLIDFNSQAVRTSLLELVPEAFRSEIVFVGGSLVEGFGNSTSDIDIVVFVRADGPTWKSIEVGPDSYSTPDGTLIQIARYGSFRVDIELVKLSEIESAATRLLSAGAGLQAQLSFPYEVVTLLHSMRIGVPLTREDDFNVLRSRFPWSALASLLANTADGKCRTATEDAIGAIRAADAGTSLLNSRLAAGHAVDAFTAAAGSTNVKVKWRFRRLKALGQNDILEKYFEAENQSGSSDNEILHQSKQRLRLAQELSILTHERLVGVSEDG